MARAATHVHDYTNLGWPEAPFGADQRPFGKRWDMLAAFAVGWTHDGSRPVPASVATVYLRIRRRGPSTCVREDTLPIGFRVTMVDDEHEVPGLVNLLDRALTRARRHAAILAGHCLGDQLARFVTPSPAPLRGATGVREAWADRSTRERGVALMVDTSAEASDTASSLGLEVGAMARCGGVYSCPASAAHATLADCLAIGLTAAVHTGRYSCRSRFDVRDAIELAGWDVLADITSQGGPRRARRRHASLR